MNLSGLRAHPDDFDVICEARGFDQCVPESKGNPSLFESRGCGNLTNVP